MDEDDKMIIEHVLKALTGEEQPDGSLRLGGWFWYGDNEPINNCGKWMYFFSNQDFAREMCIKAISEKVVAECKCTDLSTLKEAVSHGFNKYSGNEGVICFYIDGTDNEAHKRVIRFMLNNDLIRKTKNGRYYNISFKFDTQTRNGEYGDDFNGEIKLADFIDLYTGEFVH